MSNFLQQLLTDDTTAKRIDSEGNVYRIRVISKGENLFFQENENYLFCLIEARHGVIFKESIRIWEPKKRMSAKERERVSALVLHYYREVYHPDGKLV